MTLREFKALIDRIYAHADPSDTVAVKVSGGCSGASEVISAHTGFDWDEGRIILTTQEALEICVGENAMSGRKVKGAGK